MMDENNCAPTLSGRSLGLSQKQSHNSCQMLNLNLMIQLFHTKLVLFVNKVIGYNVK